MSKADETPADAVFRGEDESAGAAHPVLDLAAGLFLLAIGIWFAAMSLALPVPGGIMTAPGLLPFITAASLSAMAVVLGVSALRRRDAAPPLYLARLLGEPEVQRRVILVVCIVVYVAALDTLSFEMYWTVAGRAVPVGSFEPVTIVALSVMLRLFWTRNISHCVGVAVFWTVCLALAFRGLFNIPMPS